MNKMADAIVYNRLRDLLRESDKLRYSSNLMPCNNDSTSIADMFSDTYDTLYNSIPYDTNDMKLIEREIMSHVVICNSSNYRAIALSSIFSKILDWIILVKEKHSLCSSKLQFGFKKGYLQSNAPLVYRKLLIIIMVISLVCAHYATLKKHG